MTDNILEDPDYKASVERLDQMIRDHHRLVEDWANEHDADGTGETENTMVVGWTLQMAQVGYREGREIHSALVEAPPSLNNFTAMGLADFNLRFWRNETPVEYYGDDS